MPPLSINNARVEDENCRGRLNVHTAGRERKPAQKYLLAIWFSAMLPAVGGRGRGPQGKAAAWRFKPSSTRHKDRQLL